MDTSASRTNPSDPSDEPSADAASERSIQRAVLRAIGSRPDVRLWRQQPGNVAIINARDIAAVRAAGFAVRFMELAPRGAADLSGIVAGGKRLEIEIKTKSGYLTGDQVAWRDMIRKFGGEWLVARSIEEAVAAVERAVGR